MTATRKPNMQQGRDSPSAGHHLNSAASNDTHLICVMPINTSCVSMSCAIIKQ